MKQLLALLLVAITAVVPLAAQYDMTFREALDAMLLNNGSAKSARYDVDAAYNQLHVSRGLRLPKVDVIGGFTLMQRNVDIDLGGTKGVVTESIKGLINSSVTSGLISSSVAQALAEGLSPLMAVDWRYTLQKRAFGVIGATVSLPIYMGGRINIATKVAELELDSSSYALDATESHLVTELVERYYGVIVARSVVDVRREVVCAMSRHLSDAQAMEQEGVVASSAVAYMRFKLSEAERDLQEAIGKVSVAEAALNLIIGNGESVNPVDRIFLYDDVYAVDYFRDMADALNPILCGARLQQQLSLEGVKLARSLLYPELVAMGAAAIYSYQLSDMVPRWSIGIGVRIPIFDGLGKEYNLRAAKRESQSVASIVEDARGDIMLLVDKEYYALQNAIYNIKAIRDAMAYAESYYYSASEGFREGVVSPSDLYDACVAVAAVRVEFLDAAYQFCLSLARLLEASGLSDTFVSYLEQGEKVFI